MSEFRMPSLGADMEAGKLVEWVRHPGDRVKPGDIIAVVETQKGAIEIEVFAAGIVERVLIAVGDTVPVGTPIAILRDDHAAAVPDAGTPATPPVAAPPPPPGTAMPGAVPDLVPAHRASPAARRLAAERGLDLTTVAGSGPDGVVVFADVETALRGRSPVAERPGSDATAMRRAIAAAMARSKREIPHYYLSTTIDVTDALLDLERRNATRAPEARLLPAALHLHALASCLRRFPEFNGFHRDGGFMPSERIHVGAAIAIRGGGLVAPAIHDTDRLTVDEIMARLRDLVARVRAGRYRGSELADPTITLTSLGDRGVEAILPIINPPQVAIIGIGTPVRRPWLVEDRVVPRTTLTISLAADHRVSDGHRGALLLSELGRLVATPLSRAP